MLLHLLWSLHYLHLRRQDGLVRGPCGPVIQMLSANASLRPRTPWTACDATAAHAVSAKSPCEAILHPQYRPNRLYEAFLRPLYLPNRLYEAFLRPLYLPNRHYEAILRSTYRPNRLYEAILRPLYRPNLLYEAFLRPLYFVEKINDYTAK